MENHIRSLDILSEWMFEQRLDMAVPDGVLNPAETACSIRDLTAEIERLQQALSAVMTYAGPKADRIVVGALAALQAGEGEG